MSPSLSTDSSFYENAIRFATEHLQRSSTPDDSDDSITPDSFVASTDENGDESRVIDGEELYITADDNGWRLARKVAGFKVGRKHENMDYDTIDEWYLDKAYSIMSHQDIGAAYAGELNEHNRMAGVKHAVIERTSEDVGARIEGGEGPTYAFNNVLGDWPRDAQARFAAYESELDDRQAYHDYVEDTTTFAESRDMMDEPYTQTEIDLFYPGNPFDHENIDQQEAKTIMRLRAAGIEPDDGILSEIEDHENFRDWYGKLGTVGKAINHSGFDTSMPNSVIQETDDPGDWAESLNPSSVEKMQCFNCSTDYYKVSIGGEPMWCSDSGMYHGARYIEADEILPRDGQVSDELLCTSCCNDWEESSGEEYIVTDRGIVGARIGYGIALIIDEVGYDTPEILDDEEYEYFRENVHTGGMPPDHFQIQPDGEFGPAEPQSEAIRSLAMPPTNIENGTVFVRMVRRIDEAVWSVEIPRTNAEVAREVKEKIEDSFENVATARAN